MLCRYRHKTHWTRHLSRLAREFGRERWGDEGYSMEELVAELGAAFLCADLGVTPEVREDHAAYIASWLKVLRNDKRAVFAAAAHSGGTQGRKRMDYIDAHVHVWTPDTARYPLAPGFTKENMKPASFTPQ